MPAVLILFCHLNMTAELKLGIFEGVAYRDGVYIALVTREGLLAASFTNIPEFCTRVARTGYEGAHVWRQR